MSANSESLFLLPPQQVGVSDILDFQTPKVCQLCFIDGLCQMPF